MQSLSVAKFLCLGHTSTLEDREKQGKLMRKTPTLNPVCLNLTLLSTEWPLARHPSVPKFSLLEYKDLACKHLAGCCIKWGCIYRDLKIHLWWCVVSTICRLLALLICKRVLGSLFLLVLHSWGCRWGRTPK